MTDGEIEARKLGNPAFFLIVAIALAIAIGLAQFEPPGVAEVSALAVTSVLGAAAILWNFRSTRWFWPYMSVAALVHVLMLWRAAPLIGEASKGYILLMLPDLFVTTGTGFWLLRRLQSKSVD
jgi:hypothetical protein